MVKREIKSNNLVLKSLELLGKPIFFLFTILGVIALTILHLITSFTHHFLLLKLPQLTLPKLNLTQLPKLKLRKIQFFVPRLIVIITSSLVIIITILFSLYTFLLKDLPSPSLLSDSPPALSTKIYDRNGILLYKIYGTENRSLINLSELPPYLINATIAAEDKNFYHHIGFSPSGIARAVKNNFSCYFSHDPCSSSLQGGSTITQQLVKNVLLTPEKTLTRKLKEVYLAVLTEFQFSKDQILELYLNNIPYGGTSYGIEEASQEFFGKSAKELSLGEASLLAGLPVAPTSLSPFGTTPYMAKIRQRQVLENMVAEKMISENDKVNAEKEVIIFHPQKIEIKAPHFVMYVKSLLVSEFGEAMVERGGLTVTTTLDLSMQDELQSQINTELEKLASVRVSNGAGMVVNPENGEILAMVGSRNFFDTTHDGQVNITLRERQPGSSIKPITYTLALMKGYKPDSLINDSPICFVERGAPPYCPNNYDGKFHGEVTLSTALASSYNIPAIKLLNTLGVKNMIKLAQELGITTWNDDSRFGLALTLGGGEVTMYDMAQVYSTLANGGQKITLNSLLSVQKANGIELLSVDKVTPIQIIPANVARTISSILADPVARAPAFGLHSVLNQAGNGVSVKTGTTNNLRDNWTFGYTKNLLVATWVGNNDNSPMSSVASGITGASPIWARTMKELLGRIEYLTPTQAQAHRDITTSL